ncbi:trehalose-phosphatase [Microbacterium sp. SLBN-146]|uniref:trehalose-phosphatase n=1 Tax=Microbacterium sp. SLBN-146 TaxID=2768457 RepID=UPI00114DF1EB|nr:trehalose-phosphatase [Microbacterium sp. SLBN-146]TQJ31865.1 trehalose 6-phosphatase [Microbacterium sp. SLBN-146]
MTDTHNRAAELRRIAASDHLLVALDFDGTVSHLADEPMKARMVPQARTAIEHLAALPSTTVAFVSGRSLSDLREIAEHGDDSAYLLAGSHGAEFWIPGEGALEPEPDEVDDALRESLFRHAKEATAHMDGVWIEPKAFGLGVHTRVATSETADAANTAVDAIVSAEAPHWRRRTGKNIVEYAFRHEGKDSAVAALRERLHATAVLFAGDDVTDEDALGTLGPEDLGVRVGGGPSAASVFVADIEEFAVLLEELATLRAAARQ